MIASIAIFIVLLFAIAGVLAYLSYKQGLKTNTALDTTAAATVELAAPNSVQDVLVNPSTSGGVLGKHIIRRTNMLVPESTITDFLSSPLVESFAPLTKEEQCSQGTDGEFCRTEEGVQFFYKGLPVKLVYDTRMYDVTKLVTNGSIDLPEGGKISVAYNIGYSWPLVGNDAQKTADVVELYDFLKGMLSNSQITIEVPVSGNLAKVYHVTKRDGKPDLDDSLSSEFDVLPNALVRASYAPLREAYVAGVKYENVPMAERVDGELRPAVASGKSIVIQGGHGTGKTQLIKHIVAGLENFSLMFLNTTSLQYVVENPSLIVTAKGSGKLAIVFDEAQALSDEARHHLLQLMEGNQSINGVSFILGLNASSPDPALIRDGRVAHVVHLTQLSSNAARNTCLAIKNYKPELEINQAKLNLLVAQKEPTFTLAQVWACMQERGAIEDVEKVYRAYKAQPKKA